MNPHRHEECVSRNDRDEKGNQCTSPSLCGCGYGEDVNMRSLNASDNVLNGNWNRDDRQANVDRNDPRNENDDFGVRPAVGTYYFFTDSFWSDFSQPPAIRPISRMWLCA